jgi:MFS family permease
MGYRTLSLLGMVVMVAGTFFMSQIGVGTSQFSIMLYTSMMGMGMGLSMPAFLIALQSTVSKESLGVATSTLQFSRSIGGTLGVSILGVFLSSRLASQLLAAGVDPTSVSLNTLLDPIAGANIAIEGPLRQALAVSIAGMFIIAFLAALAALAAVAFAPPGKISQLMQQRLPEQPLDS